MALQCGVTVVYRRPCRSKPRKYTAKDASRIICYAIRDGATLQEILSESDCLEPAEPECDCEKVRETAAELEASLAALANLVAAPQAKIAEWTLGVINAVRFIPGATELAAYLGSATLIAASVASMQTAIAGLLIGIEINAGNAPPTIFEEII